VSCPSHFNDSVTIVEEAGWATGWSGQVQKILPPHKFSPQTAILEHVCAFNMHLRHAQAYLFSHMKSKRKPFAFRMHRKDVSFVSLVVYCNKK
jgi:hypothetical protein